MIDVDHFKHYNDRHGHQAGDLALAQVHAARQPPRSIDVRPRLGGEESALTFPLSGVGEAAKRICSAAEAKKAAVRNQVQAFERWN